MDRIRAFIDDLVFDLRERRLLLPVILLAVAVVAVPVALRGSEPAPPPAAATPPDVAETQPAVAALAESGVRTGNSRLSGEEPSNPFRQQMRPKASIGAIDESGSGDAGATGTTSTADAAASPATATDPAASQQQAVDQIADKIANEVTGDSGDSTEPPSHTGGSSDASKPPVIKVEGGDSGPIIYTADVSFGELGDRESYKGVERYKFLPKAKDPIVFLAGFESGGKRAVFTLPETVTNVYEDGQCAPRARDCAVLRLKPGQTAKLKMVTADGAIVYALTLREINTGGSASK